MNVSALEDKVKLVHGNNIKKDELDLGSFIFDENTIVGLIILNIYQKEFDII